MNEARKSGKRAGRQNGSDQRVIFAVEWPKNRERSLRAGLLQQQRTRRDLVNAHPHANFLLNRLERLIDTVHKFQGDERDVMIFSPVRRKSVLLTGFPVGPAAFKRLLGCPELLDHCCPIHYRVIESKGKRILLIFDRGQRAAL